MSDVTSQLRGVITAIRNELSVWVVSDDGSKSHYTELHRIVEELLSHIRTQKTAHITTIDSKAYAIGQESLGWILNIHYKELIEEKLDFVAAQITNCQSLATSSPERPPDTKVIKIDGDTLGFESQENKDLRRRFDAHAECQEVAKSNLSKACTELLAELGRELGWHRSQDDGEDPANTLSMHSPSEEEWVVTKVNLDFCTDTMTVRKHSTGEVIEVKGRTCFELLKLIASRGNFFTSKKLISEKWEHIGGQSDGLKSRKSQLNKVRKQVLDKWEMVLQNRQDVGWRVSSASNLWEKRKKAIEKAAARKSNSKPPKKLKEN